MQIYEVKHHGLGRTDQYSGHTVSVVTDWEDIAYRSARRKKLELNDDNTKTYKAKAKFYMRKYQERPAIAKLRSNISLTDSDVKELKNIL